MPAEEPAPDARAELDPGGAGAGERGGVEGGDPAPLAAGHLDDPPDRRPDDGGRRGADPRGGPVTGRREGGRRDPPVDGVAASGGPVLLRAGTRKQAGRRRASRHMM